MPSTRSYTVNVSFDTPVAHPFSYLVPEGTTVAPGQRVVAPLGNAERVGVVVGLHEGVTPGLKPFIRVLDAAPLLDADTLELTRWIAAQSLSSLGSTLAALTPPVVAAASVSEREAGFGRGWADIDGSRLRTPPAHTRAGAEPTLPEVFIGAGRERRLIERLGTTDAPALVIVPDVEAAGRWTQRLEKYGTVARLDSGVDDEARARAWTALAAGHRRLAVGTRSALLAPLPPGGTLALVDEHEAAHKPPGAPRLHSRDVAAAYTRAARTLTCRVCGREAPMLDTCPGCHGRRLSPFGWGVERVEHAVRRRFPKARVARYDPDATRGAKAERQRAEAAAAEIVIGTRGALRLFGPGSLGIAGFVSPDQLLRMPDFRAGERLFALLWGAAERVAAGGGLIVQSQTPAHYVFEAFARQDLAAFYRHEMKFRGELGYPPFRRLAIITVTAASAAAMRTLADEIAAALTSVSTFTVYGPASARRDRARRIVVKGHADLASRLGEALADFRRPRPKSRGIIDVEVDPVEWPS